MAPRRLIGGDRGPSSRHGRSGRGGKRKNERENEKGGRANDRQGRVRVCFTVEWDDFGWGSHAESTMNGSRQKDTVGTDL